MIGQWQSNLAVFYPRAPVRGGAVFAGANSLLANSAAYAVTRGAAEFAAQLSLQAGGAVTAYSSAAFHGQLGLTADGSSVAPHIYHILVGGQSNAEGTGEGRDPNASVGATPGYDPLALGVVSAARGRKFVGGLEPAPGGLSSLVPLTEEFNPGLYDSARVQNITVASTMVNWLAAHAAVQGVYVVSNEGYSGQTLDNIKKGASTHAYEHHLAQVTAAKALADAAGQPYRVLGVVLEHGESDNSLYYGLTYRTGLRTLQQNYDADIKAITGQTENVVLFLSAPPQSAYNLVGSTQLDDPYFAKSATQAMYLAAADYPNDIQLVTPDYILNYWQGPHYGNSSQRLLGEYFAAAINAKCFGGVNWAPIRVTSAVLSGTSIQVNFAVMFPPLVWDTSRTTWHPTRGWEYRDDSGSASPTVTAVAITGPQQVTLTLSAAPTGGNRVVRHGFSTFELGGARGELADSCPLDSLLTDLGNSKGLRNWCPQLVAPVT